MNDWLGFFILMGYIFGMIGVAELLRYRLGYSINFTRKVIHIGVGMVSWALHFLFDSPLFFLIGCAVFVVITFVDWKYGLIASMASSDESNLGTVYFPIAAGVVAWLFWETPPLMVAALMPLTWGDGLAPVVGRTYGRNAYFVYNHKRTLEGSAGFFVAGFLFTWLALWLVPGMPMITPVAALAPALVITTATTLTEAVSIWGLDNLTITAVAILILKLWPF